MVAVVGIGGVVVGVGSSDCSGGEGESCGVVCGLGPSPFSIMIVSSVWGGEVAGEGLQSIGSTPEVVEASCDTVEDESASSGLTSTMTLFSETSEFITGFMAGMKVLSWTASARTLILAWGRQGVARVVEVRDIQVLTEGKIGTGVGI